MFEAGKFSVVTPSGTVRHFLTAVARRRFLIAHPGSVAYYGSEWQASPGGKPARIR